MTSLWNQEERTGRLRRSRLSLSYASSARIDIQSRARGVATGDLLLGKTLETTKSLWYQEQTTGRLKCSLLWSGYPSSARNNIRSRAWGAAKGGCSFRVDKCWVVKSGGGTVDLEPSLSRNLAAAPTLVPAATERTVTTRSSAQVRVNWGWCDLLFRVPRNSLGASSVRLSCCLYL